MDVGDLSAAESGFEIDQDEAAIQHIAPVDGSEHYENVAFSPSGERLAVAAAGTNAILLFRRDSKGRFQDEPYSAIAGPMCGLDFPHGVAFAASRGGELLAVSQRRGVISIWETGQVDHHYGPKPAFEIRGAQTRLDFSDSVAFVPPDNAWVAACNYTTNAITFYRRISISPMGFSLEPEFVLKSLSLSGADGIAFSRCGRWLAVASHGSHSVNIFERRSKSNSRSGFMYGPTPITVIVDRMLRYPHAVAFSPRTNHLVVTNSGANYFCVYAPTDGFRRARWSRSAVARIPFCPDDVFEQTNSSNEMEGGPKGVAMHDNTLAVCGAEFGIKIYSFKE